MSSSDHASDKLVTQNSPKPASANYPVLLHKLAQACLTEGRNEDAIGLLKSELSPSQPRSSDEAMSELDLADAYMIDGRPKDAIDLLERRTQITIARELICTPEGKAYIWGSYLLIYILRSQYLPQAYPAEHRNEDAINPLKSEPSPSQPRSSDQVMLELDLAAAYMIDGRPKDAIDLLERRTQITIARERICTPEGRDYTWWSYLQIYILRRQYLAQAYLAHDRAQDGIGCLEKLESMVGHIDTMAGGFTGTTLYQRAGTTMRRLIHHCLARAYLANGRINDAINRLERVSSAERGGEYMDYPLQDMLKQDLDAAKDADKHSEQELTGASKDADKHSEQGLTDASKDDPELSGLKRILWAFQTQRTFHKLSDALYDDYHQWDIERSNRRREQRSNRRQGQRSNRRRVRRSNRRRAQHGTLTQ
ncbi:hypothetical protein EDB81DRAFT_862473 [Dactylonectria macrodidyma]|uniref:Uncharacterized protein n=1 Tax=Dactylonectria macrodidyma TaxID=307937 RepID=A0A9P9IAV9_9HYPO|nr:hypothetical protein EDB81DRAFT_862473 [Dactylonectria macrodidyma]